MVHRHAILLLATIGMAISSPASAAPAGSPVVAPAGDHAIILEKGSNFRDLGGYVGAGGKRVRPGLIFRSGAMPSLTEADYIRLSQLHIRSIIDFRSTEEREVAPTQLDDRTGALFLSNDYSFKAMNLAKYAQGNGRYSSNLYETFPTLLVPQYRALFNRLLAHDGAVLFNCSAGQDRTGTAAALVLSALGVPRATILADYHLSTQLRRPEYEMPPLKSGDFPNNPVASYYEKAQAQPGTKAEPLYGSDGRAFLEVFLDNIDKRWGSVDGYLEKEIGLSRIDIARLRSLYLQ